MKLWAISDLHLANRLNREALLELEARPDDWLILAGDVGETEAHLLYALEVLSPRFAQLLWVPGNHDLWTVPGDPSPLRGEARYNRLVEICRRYGVLTPEDPYPRWPGPAGGGPTEHRPARGGPTEHRPAGGGPTEHRPARGGPTVYSPANPDFVVAPLFLLYDYSFRPREVPADRALDWAADSGIVCSDEYYLHPAPHASRQAWCAARLRATEQRLEQAAGGGDRLILINHWPLRRDLATLPRIPRFSIWCGTTATEDWHLRFHAAVVVHGHLHIKATHFRDGVRFEEVSLGYPRDWRQDQGVGFYLRQILPLPATSMAASPSVRTG